MALPPQAGAVSPSPRSATAASRPLLRAHGLAACVEGRTLWRDVDIALDGGDRLGVRGPSGSGKTMLLRTLAGLEPLQHGELAFCGRSLDAWAMPDYRARVMYLAQRPALREGSVEAALRAPFAFARRRGTAFPRERAVQWLAALGRAEHFLQQRCERLSGGETQIVALLRALLTGPDVLLLDEPSASLDAATVASIERLIMQWLDAATDRACIWTSHDQAQLDRTCERVLSLEVAA